MVRLDIKDRKILSELDMNARIPMTELARKVALSRQVVEYRIKRMQKEGVIFGALTIFDSVVVGYNWYRVVFRLLKVTKKQKSDLIDYLAKNRYVFWLGEVGGNWDLVINLICKDNFKFNEIFEDIIIKYGSFIMDYQILIYLEVHDLERNYILKQNQERKEFYHEMKVNPEIELDELNREIIRLISKNALLTNIELGQKLKVSGNTIKNRTNEMIKNNVILGFRLFINPSIIGYQSHILFLELNKLDLKKEWILLEYLKTIPNIVFLVKHIGKWRIGMEIETKDELEFQDIFVDIRGRFSEIITDFESFPLFKDHIINYFPEGNL